MTTFLTQNCLVALCLLAVPLGWAQGQQRTDRDGAALPERAVCRLGSNRFLHDDYLIAAVFSPDGNKIASASCDGRGMVWEWPSGKPLHKIPAGEMRFSPDSQFLAVWRKTQLTIVDVRTGEAILEEKATSLPVFSRKTNLIAWTVQPTKVGVRELSQTSKVRFLERSRAIKALAFDSAGELLAAEMHDNSISLRNLDQGKEVRQFLVAAQEVRWVELTADARRLAFSTKKNQVSVFDLQTAKRCFPVSQVPEEFEPRVLREDGKLLLLADRSISQGLLWNLAEARAVSRLVGGSAGTGGFSPKGDLLATGGTNSPHAPLFWDTKTGQRLDLAAGHHSFVLCVAFSPDGKEAATCTFIRGDPFVRFWDTATGKPLRKLEAFPSGVTRVAFSPDGKWIVAGGYWQKTRDASVWEARAFKNVLNVKGHFYGAQLLALSSDGTKLATVGGATTPDDVIIWDLKTGKSLAKHPNLGRSSQHVAFLPGNDTLALGDIRNIHLWDWETNRVRTLKVSGSNMTFSPDGWVVAVTESSGTKLIEVLTGEEVWSDPAGKEKPSHGSLAFAPNGRTIAVGSGTGLVHLVDWSKPGEKLSFRGSDFGPFHLVFSRDGTRLAGVENATALIWNVADVVGRPLGKSAKVEAKDLAAWCGLLSSTDGRAAYRAVWKLAAARDEAVAELKRQLPLARTDAKQIARWIADLDDKNFATREKALLELTQLGEDARRPLELAMKNPRSLEQQRRLETISAKLNGVSTTKLHQVRTLMVLEQIGSPSAREVLRWLAKGETDAFVARQAHLALERLDSK
ncbi:MAG TPA: WD40 repeat domain-containing protein [Gemmataceae bacterium]|nr:WD40 repeat domain-containing protein [Gemmataceae bacterium]